LRRAQSRLAAFGIEDAALEAELLLSDALGVARTQLFAALDTVLTPAQREAFGALLERRLAHEPLAYITGHREFYGIDLLCAPDALIPRPETELLVELALEWVRGQGSRVRAATIVDVGTGTGAIAIAIAANAPEVRVIATDTSAAALALAARNARRAGVAGRIDFARGSLLGPIYGADVIVANLPYISDDVYATLPPELHHEPEPALRAGPCGTELIEALLAQGRDVLAPGGLLLAEHAWDQGALLRETAAALFPYAHIETRRDLAGLERALVIAR
jgi:release factor glutamine methyltransferase